MQQNEAGLGLLGVLAVTVALDKSSTSAQKEISGTCQAKVLESSVVRSPGTLGSLQSAPGVLASRRSMIKYIWVSGPQVLIKFTPQKVSLAALCHPRFLHADSLIHEKKMRAKMGLTQGRQANHSESPP